MNIEDKISKILNEDFVDVDATLNVIFNRDIMGYIRKILKGFWDGKPEEDAVIIKGRLKGFGLSEDEVSEVRDVYASSIKIFLDRYNIEYQINKKTFGIYTQSVYGTSL